MSQLAIICVGDNTTDTFIKLGDEQAHSYDNEHGKWLAVPFGSKIEYDHAEFVPAAGNAPNAAISFARLGFKAGLISNVGKDNHGRDVIAALEKEKVDTRYVHINPSKRSNANYVLWYKEERTILIKHEDYDYHWPHLRPKEIPKWIYFSSTSKNGLDMHDDLADWLEEHKDVEFAFSPGTFQIDMGLERLRKLYARADVLLMNREEATELTGGNHDDIHDLMNKLHDVGAKTVVITDGPAGAYASDTKERLKMPPYPDPTPPVERTGAGDAFSSAFVAAIMDGGNIEAALQWAPINSMSVVQQTGSHAGLLTQEKIAEYLQHAPEWYKPETF